MSELSSIRLVQTGEGKYVKIGKRKINVHKSISNNDLIKWVIKHFHKKRRRGTKVEKPSKVSAGTISASYAQGQADIARTKEREMKEKLDKAESELNSTKLLMAVKASAPVVPRLPPGAGQRAIMPPPPIPPLPPGMGQKALPSGIPATPPRPVKSASASLSSPPIPPRPGKALAPGMHDPQYSEAEKQAAMQKGQVILDAAQEAAKEAQASERAIRLAALLEEKRNLVNFKKDDFDRAISKNWTQKKLFKVVKNAGIALPPNPTNELMIEKLLATKNNLLGENDVQAALDAEYDPKIAGVDAKIVVLGQSGKGRADEPGLSDLQITKKLKKYPQFAGTIAADEIPTLRDTGGSMGWVMNTEPRSLPGEHWVAFFREAGKPEMEFYDPLGDPISIMDTHYPVRRDLKALLKSMGMSMNFKYNKVPDQHESTNNCGPFCIRFLQQRFKGKSFEEASGLDHRGEAVIEQWKKNEHAPRKK